MERNLPTFGVASLRKWLDKRCEKKIAKWEPVPAPTLPLPWEHFKRMPKRLKGGRHRDVHLSEDMEVPDVHRGEPCSCPAAALHMHQVRLCLPCKQARTQRGPSCKGIFLPADSPGEGQRPSSADDSVMREARLTQRQAGEDHARGVAAMPQSTNAPSSPSAQHGTQQAGPGDDASSARHAHPGPGVSEQESGAQYLCSCAAHKRGKAPAASVAMSLLQTPHRKCCKRREQAPTLLLAGSRK